MIEEFEIGDLVQDATNYDEISFGFVYDVGTEDYYPDRANPYVRKTRGGDGIYVFWFSGPYKYDMRCREWAEDLVLVSKGVTR